MNGIPGSGAEAIRAQIAWLIWCFQQGYRDPSDRAILENWMPADPETLHPDDVKTRACLLVMADEIIAAAWPLLWAEVAATQRERTAEAVTKIRYHAERMCESDTGHYDHVLLLRVIADLLDGPS